MGHCEWSMWLATACQIGLGLVWIVRLVQHERDYKRWRAAYKEMAAELQGQCDRLLADLRQKMRVLPDRWAEYCADPTNPKWARGLFYDDPDSSSSVH